MEKVSNFLNKKIEESSFVEDNYSIIDIINKHSNSISINITNEDQAYYAFKKLNKEKQYYVLKEVSLHYGSDTVNNKENNIATDLVNLSRQFRKFSRFINDLPSYLKPIFNEDNPNQSRRRLRPNRI